MLSGDENDSEDGKKGLLWCLTGGWNNPSRAIAEKVDVLSVDLNG